MRQRVSNNIAKGLLWFYGAAAVIIVGLAVGIVVSAVIP